MNSREVSSEAGVSPCFARLEAKGEAMIIKSLVVVALVGGGAPDAARTPATVGRSAERGKEATGSRPRELQVLPPIGVSGGRAAKSASAVPAKYSSSGSSDWRQTRLTAGQEPPPASSTENELPPAAPAEAPPVAPPEPPAEVPPAIEPPPLMDQPPPAVPETPGTQPPASPAPEATAPTTPNTLTDPAPPDSKLADGQAAGYEDQNPYFRSPCICIYEPWEVASWYAGTRSVFLWRTVGRNEDLLTNGIMGQTLLNTDQMEFPLKWGQEVFLGHQVDSAHALEVSYLWLADATATNEFRGTGGRLPVEGFPALGVLNDITALDAKIRSKFWAFDLNFVNLMRDGTDHPWRAALFIGGRIMGIGENFGMGTRNVNNEVTNLDIRVENALYGGQLGGRLTYRELLPNFNVDMMLKGGIFGNIMDYRQTFALDNGPLVTRVRSEDGTTHVAQAVEGGLEGVYKLRQNIHLTFGYRMIYVSELVRVTNQILLNAPLAEQPIRGNSDIFYHGFVVGLRVYWGQRADPNCRSGCCTPYVVSSGCCP